MDWKDALASLSGLPEGEEAPQTAAEPIACKRQQAPLHVVIEKKGRGGKTATIVEGFEISDEEIEDIARGLRKKLGTGGSARGGEILIQGERRQEVTKHLRDLGFKVS